MKLPGLTEFKRVLDLYNITNIILSLSFVVTKLIPGVCDAIYDHCGFDQREHEILIFMAVVIFWKNRRSVNYLHYLSNVYLFAKVASLVLFLRVIPVLGIFYGILCFVFAIVVPQPSTIDSDKIIYFVRDQLTKELERDKKSVFVVLFTATWIRDGVYVSENFNKLSERFSLPNLKFGKVDVGKDPKEGERYGIYNNPIRRQLPSMALFRDGKLVARRPEIATNGRAKTYKFDVDTVTLDFDLLNIYEDLTKGKSNSAQKKDN